MGGKTGAAEKQPRDKQHYVTSFIGFMPAEDPQIVFYVVLDEAQVEDFDTSRAAQELARDIMIDLIPYLEIYPVDESYEINVGGLPTQTEPQTETQIEYVTDGNGETVTDADGNPETVAPSGTFESETTEESGEDVTGASEGQSEPSGVVPSENAEEETTAAETSGEGATATE